MIEINSMRGDGGPRAGASPAPTISGWGLRRHERQTRWLGLRAGASPAPTIHEEVALRMCWMQRNGAIVMRVERAMVAILLAGCFVKTLKSRRNTDMSP